MCVLGVVECGVMGSTEKSNLISMFKASMSTMRIDVLSIDQIQTLRVCVCGGGGLDTSWCVV